MCGITGLISKNPIKPADLEIINEMNNTLYHRGPDSMGVFQDSNLILAMRRLKIIDLSGGDQPLSNEDNSHILVVNGEIYNHIELRKDLETKHKMNVKNISYEKHKENLRNQLIRAFQNKYGCLRKAERWHKI